MQNIADIKVYPFLKWAGGKRWLTHQCADILPKKGDFNCYFEPFLGSGAVFFYLKPDKAFLSDINGELIETYNAIKLFSVDLVSLLCKHQELHSKDYYYKVRAEVPKSIVERAARFIYLNRTCWNGLYRVNNSGGFNVPIGTKNKVVLDTDDFVQLSKFLSNVEISNLDFEVTISKAQKNDFVFVDPPYTVKHNSNAFVQYNENLFSWTDQERLRDCIKKAISRGVKVLVTNANHASVHTLYDGMGKKICLSRASVLASNPAKRGIYEELAIRCGY